MISEATILFGDIYFANAAPIFTLRKRDGDAPCPVPIVCMGWPLPQFGVPQKIHSSRPQIASQIPRIPS